MHSFSYGRTTDRPVMGDWDGNGSVTPGVVRGSTWYTTDSLGGASKRRTFRW